jgi:hypothetical protein
MPLYDFHSGDARLPACADTLAKYAEPLLREVAGRLIRPRNTWTAGEIRERLLAALADPVLIDRTLRTLSAPARQLLKLVGISRQPHWRVRGLLDLLSALGHEDGTGFVLELLENGLLYPSLTFPKVIVSSFTEWLQQLTAQSLSTFALPLAAARVRTEDLGLPALPSEALATVATQEVDGLEWPLRTAVLWQLVRKTPLRRTQQGGFFKRDLDRLRGHPILATAPADHVGPVPDPDMLALLLALNEEIILPNCDQIAAGEFPVGWQSGTNAAVVGLWSALPGITNWDPVDGWADESDAGRWVAPAAALAVALLENVSAGTWVRVADVEAWFRHTTEAQRGTAEALLLGVLHQLRVVQAAQHEGEAFVRLSPLGRALAEGTKSLPPDRPAAEQTLLVQPNLEIVLFRQGVTPSLVARLSHVAEWEALGLACTLVLTAESVYHGLESGETLADLVTLLERHGTRALSETVLGSLRSWASKRERVLVYPSAFLLEFRCPADLDRALRQGLVERRVTDRIGLVASEDRVAYQQLRLVGTRDYLAPDELCAGVEDDGLTLVINDHKSDLLLESELKRFAEPAPPAAADDRPRYRLTPATLRAARRQGLDARTLDAWFLRRAGGPLPATAKLLLTGDEAPPLALERLVVLRVPYADLADGIATWPETRGLVAERLAPTLLAVPAEAVERLQAKLAEVGVTVRGSGGHPE